MEVDDKDHDKRELELVREHQDGKADDDTDRNSTSVNSVVPCAFGYSAGIADGIGNGSEPGSVKTTSDVPRAASVAPSTGIPILVRKRAGASFVHHLSWHKDDQDRGQFRIREDSSKPTGIHDGIIEGGEWVGDLSTRLKGLKSRSLMSARERGRSQGNGLCSVVIICPTKSRRPNYNA